MTHIFCKGKWVELIERNGWFWCSGCGNNIWRTDSTFELDRPGVASGYGTEEDNDQDGGEQDGQEVSAGTVAGGAAQGGRV
jgi:hypothetical protein